MNILGKTIIGMIILILSILIIYFVSRFLGKLSKRIFGWEMDKIDKFLVGFSILLIFVLVIRISYVIGNLILK